MKQTDNPISSSSVQSTGVTAPSNTDSPTAVAGTAVNKEHELPSTVAPEAVQTLTHEVEISPEVEQAGVTGIGEMVELPPDVAKLGVTPSTPAAATTTTFPTVTLPISDNQVISGLHAKVLFSLHWLAVWCIKKLKKAHIMLKVIHGKIMRIKT